MVDEPEHPAANTSIVADSQAGSQLQSATQSWGDRAMPAANRRDDVQMTVTEVQTSVVQPIMASVDPAEVSMLSIVNSTPEEGGSEDRTGGGEEDGELPPGPADGSSLSAAADVSSTVCPGCWFPSIS
jgi:hypothetical protein